MLSYVILFSIIVSVAKATFGVDVSQAVSEADFHCLKSNYQSLKKKKYVSPQ